MDLFAAAVLVVTILLVYLRIQKQEESSLRLQAENHRNQLRAGIYEKVADVLAEWGGQVSTADSLVRSVVSSLSLTLKGGPSVRGESAQDLSAANQAAARATSRVLLVLERYEIVFLHFHEARRMVASAHRELLDSYHELHTTLAPVLPLPDPNQPDAYVGPLLPLEAQKLLEIEALAERYHNACGDLQGYLLDLGVEAQNELLGGLFARAVPPRHPKDPNVKVLSRSAEVLVERPEGRW